MGKRLIIKGADFSTNGIDVIVDLELEHGVYTGDTESTWNTQYSYYATSKRVALNNGLHLKTKQNYCITALCQYQAAIGDMSGRFYANNDTVTHPVTDEYGRTQDWRIYSDNIGGYPIIKVMVQRVDTTNYNPITLDQDEIFDIIEYVD